jgi:hypothetical protein
MNDEQRERKRARDRARYATPEYREWNCERMRRLRSDILYRLDENLRRMDAGIAAHQRRIGASDADVERMARDVARFAEDAGL